MTLARGAAVLAITIGLIAAGRVPGEAGPGGVAGDVAALQKAVATLQAQVQQLILQVGNVQAIDLQTQLSGIKNQLFQAEEDIIALQNEDDQQNSKLDALGTALTGYEIVTQEVAASQDSFQQLLVNCPATPGNQKNALGTGWAILDGPMPS